MHETVADTLDNSLYPKNMRNKKKIVINIFYIHRLI